MITGFETITKELTDYELRVVSPRVCEGMSRRIGKSNSITNGLICDKLRGEGMKVSEPRIRKIMHYLIVTGRLKRVIATSKGYYIATNKAEMLNYRESLAQRVRAISLRYEAISKDISNLNL